MGRPQTVSLRRQDGGMRSVGGVFSRTDYASESRSVCGVVFRLNFDRRLGVLADGAGPLPHRTISVTLLSVAPLSGHTAAVSQRNVRVRCPASFATPQGPQKAR